MSASIQHVPVFNIPGKGFVIKMGNVFWVYGVYKDTPKIAGYAGITTSLVEAILAIEKL